MKLAEAYGVPRSRIRRVLDRLQEEQVVVFELNRGAFVSRPTVEEARHVLEARRHLEGVVVKLACEKATAEDIGLLRAHLVREERAFAEGRADVYRIAAEFHHLLSAIAANPVIAQMLNTLIRRGVLIQSVYERVQTGTCLTHEHRVIVDRISENRPLEAEQEMRQHFEKIFASLDLTDQRRTETDIYEFNGAF
ncbi:MAG: hypothetical protein DI556_21080 [Rhodovulum sulfidophilum]|uniref:GntR C-terminal domain-containing protein n=1 Tax=Rhodovulum sulfidophilum TaxID=35806 RepID=A0A2W5MY68_RHOSU|nr:MAG: hypothetical protein DI556_21080 [Rhodovulum sulfidophilum]